MSSSRRVLGAMFCCFLLAANTVSAASNMNFSYNTFTSGNFSFLGDAHVRDGEVVLTHELNTPTVSAGAMFYNQPISFFDRQTNVTASFSSMFTFRIQNNFKNDLSLRGEGLAFVLSPDNHTLGSPAFMGVGVPYDSDDAHNPDTSNRFIAIEFDTQQTSLFGEVEDEHVGLDINGLVSVNSSDALVLPIGSDPDHFQYAGVDFVSGSDITAWVEYESSASLLKVYLSYTRVKPDIPVLSVQSDLTAYLQEMQYIGFAASSDGSTEHHSASSWTFETHGFPNHTVTESHSNHSRRRLRLNLVVAFGVSGWSVLVILGMLLVCYRVVGAGRGGQKLSEVTDQIELKEIRVPPTYFQFTDILQHTKNFHTDFCLGGGLLGSTYKVLLSGRLCVVKRFRQHPYTEGNSKLFEELHRIASLRHKNLVHLVGWSVAIDELVLVYDWMAHGSIDKRLHLTENSSLLDWPHRHQIAIDLACALTYIHQECEQQVIHRNIKTSNIFLEDNGNIRLGDFGLELILTRTSPTAATMGYLAPEYTHYEQASVETDVYSYGVVALELATGKRPLERTLNPLKGISLVDWVGGMQSEGRILKAADEKLHCSFNDKEMERLLQVGLMCTNPTSSQRPSMRRVLQILCNEASPSFANTQSIFNSSRSRSFSSFWGSQSHRSEVQGPISQPQSPLLVLSPPL